MTETHVGIDRNVCTVIDAAIGGGSGACITWCKAWLKVFGRREREQWPDHISGAGLQISWGDMA